MPTGAGDVLTGYPRRFTPNRKGVRNQLGTYSWAPKHVANVVREQRTQRLGVPARPQTSHMAYKPMAAHKHQGPVAGDNLNKGSTNNRYPALRPPTRKVPSHSPILHRKQTPTCGFPCSSKANGGTENATTADAKKHSHEPTRCSELDACALCNPYLTKPPML